MGNVSSLPDYWSSTIERSVHIWKKYTIRKEKETEKEREREMKYDRVNEVEGLYSYTLYLEKPVTYNCANEVQGLHS